MSSEDAAPPEYLVLDGGIGTEILRLNPIDQNLYKHQLWSTNVNFTNPKIVQDVQRQFLEAGADAVMTNTYRPHTESVMRTLSIDRSSANEEMRKFARSTCQVRDEFWQRTKDMQTGRVRPLVVASLGPYGCHMVSGSDYAGGYVDTVSVEEMRDGFKEKAQALYEGGADVLGFETIPATKEAEAINLVMEQLPKAKAWVAFCCKDGYHLGNGEKFSDAVLTTLSCDAVIGVGVNCSDPAYVTSLLKEIPDVVKQKKRIVVYPNNGVEWDTVNKKWMGNPEFNGLAQYVPEWLENGANWIGGCCFVTADHITEVKKKMDTYNSKRSDR